MNGMTLLQMAVALLIAAQQPNLPPDLKIKALDIANLAIQTSMEDQQTPTPEFQNSSPGSTLEQPYGVGQTAHDDTVGHQGWYVGDYSGYGPKQNI